MAAKKKAKKPAKTAKKSSPKKSAKKAVKKKVTQAAPKQTAPKLLPGMPSWHGLSTSDDRAAAEFYKQVLGMSYESVTMGNETMLMLSAGKEMVAHVAPLGPGQSPRWLVFFHVNDVDAAARRCEAQGGKIVMPPGDIPPGRMAVLQDAQGAEFALFKSR